ncbi:uncharacterized protein LOC135377711 [Ornithodoros turicata]|uniref:uncharacterized protein LOC135377711 n=1 Tax=Ornithodoros turicata TaxID=34597 RepID=UPI00313A4522
MAEAGCGVGFSQDAEPLPCWCRGVERLPLEELPIFQYLKAQHDNAQKGCSSSNDVRILGLGRGRPRSNIVVPIIGNSASSSSVEDCHRDDVKLYRKPLCSDVSKQQQQQNVSDAADPHRVHPPNVQSLAVHNERPIHQPKPRLSTERTDPPAVKPTQQRNFCARHPVPKRPALRKGSFNPDEYQHNFTLNHWVKTHTRKVSYDTDDDDDESSDADELVFDDERHSSISSSKPVTSSTGDYAVKQSCARNVHQLQKVMEIDNLPSSVTSDVLGELLADFGIVESISMKENDTGSCVAEVRMVNEAVLDQIVECLQISSPFGALSKPLSVRIVSSEG